MGSLARPRNFCSCLAESLVRDRIVITLRDSALIKKLLKVSKLTLQGGVGICRREQAVGHARIAWSAQDDIWETTGFQGRFLAGKRENAHLLHFKMSLKNSDDYKPLITNAQ